MVNDTETPFEGSTSTQENASSTAVLKEPDPSLIRGYDQAAIHMDRPVGLTHFQIGGKDLYIINARHNGDLQSPTHQTVRRVFEGYAPEVVITEGHPTDLSDSDRARLTGLNRELVTHDGAYVPESGYAVYLADESHIPFIGGEISGAEFLERMQAHGYNTEDVLADSFMRQVETLPLEERLTMTEEEFIARHAQRLLALANKRVNPARDASIPELTLDQFKNWYSTHPLSRARSFKDVSHDDFVPHKQGEYYQQMACTSGLVRDEHLLQLIHDTQQQHDRVLVVYGDGHLTSLERALQAMYGGPGEFIQLVARDGTLLPVASALLRAIQEEQ